MMSMTKRQIDDLVGEWTFYSLFRDEAEANKIKEKLLQEDVLICITRKGVKWQTKQQFWQACACD